MAAVLTIGGSGVWTAEVLASNDGVTFVPIALKSTPGQWRFETRGASAIAVRLATYTAGAPLGTLSHGGALPVTTNVSAIIGNRLNYERGLSDKTAIDQLLSGIGTANTNWTDYQTTTANARRQAQEDVATRLAQQAGYHGLPGESEEETAARTAAAQDYSGGPGSFFQPASDVQALMDNDQASGQWDSWANVMGKNINAANKPALAPKPKPAQVFKPAPATAKLIQKMRAKGEMSSWEKAMQGMGG
jgi:hypothetical protein